MIEQYEQGKREILRYTMRIEAPAGNIFPLLCPVREYDWIPQWHCRLIYSDSGYAEPGCVFQTDFGDGFGPEIWVVSEYQPNSCIAFIRTGEHRLTRYRISLKSEGDATSLLWCQEITCLTRTGKKLITALSATGFESTMKKLEQMLTHYLSQGAMLQL